MSRFADIGFAPENDVASLMERYENDPHDTKLNLSSTLFLNDDGTPIEPNAVRIAKSMILLDDTLNKNYVPTLGLDAFTKSAKRLLLGRDCPADLEGRAFSVQVIAGTGGCRVAIESARSIFGSHYIYTSDETWNVFKLMCTSMEYELRNYRFLKKNAEDHALDLSGMLEDLEGAPKNSIIVLYACGHNPTGLNLTKDEWVAVAKVIKKQGLIPFFDTAFIGLVSGDLEEDCWPVRYFVSQGIQFMANQSFSINFCLYGERVGNLTFVVDNEYDVPRMKIILASIIKGIYSHPPCFGARVVALILNNDMLYEQIKRFFKYMTSRIARLRHLLREELEQLCTPGDMSFITKQKGLFLYFGFNERQEAFLAKEYHIYIKGGCLDLSGITPRYANHLAKAIHHTILYDRVTVGLKLQLCTTCDNCQYAVDG